jgi:transposase
MYIREYITSNRKTKAKYVTHRLVESFQTPNGPRQRIVLHLGTLEIPKTQWRALAALLEARLAGQSSLLDADYPELVTIADRALEHRHIVDQHRSDKSVREAHQELVAVDLNSVTTMQSRSLGPELVANATWKRLGFDRILARCRFTPRQVALAKAVIFGRLIEPGSDLATWRWISERSVLPDLEPELAQVNKNDIYEIADILLQHKETLEKTLFSNEQQLFPPQKTLFLYDLTNTYFEGQCPNNEWAARGCSKEKRSDCPLVTLALVVDYRGFPVLSRIYDGNQSEPATLPEILAALQSDMDGLFAGVLPTVVMDRGIATAQNIALMKSLGFPFVVVERAAKEHDYLPVFEKEQASFERLETSPEQAIYLRKETSDLGSRVLVISEGRKAKEEAMDALKERRFLEDINRLAGSVDKGNITTIVKVHERIGRLKQKYPSIAKHYDINVETANDKASRVVWTRKPSRDERASLTGCYVIETTHQALFASEIWRLYTMLTRVEAAFRSLKTDLGVRPVYHQLGERTMGHLFISVLAYHLLICIEQKLLENGDHRSWATIRKTLSTHQRSTVVMTAADGRIHHIRVSGNPETVHQDIYRIFEVKDPFKRRRHIAGSRL